MEFSRRTPKQQEQSEKMPYRAFKFADPEEENARRIAYLRSGLSPVVSHVHTKASNRADEF